MNNSIFLIIINYIKILNSNQELLEQIQHLEAKIQRRDLTINNLRREAALAMLQTVDQTRVDGGTPKILDRILFNDDKVNQYEDDITVLKKDQESKTQEIISLKKELQKEVNKYQNTINTLEKNNIELQEKLKISIHENKQKTVFLSGKDNLLEHLGELVRKRDEKYAELEEKYTTLMV